MTLQTYYHRLFLLDLHEAIRLHSHRHEDGDYFHTQDFKRKVSGVPDGKYRSLFLCFFALAVLADEFMYLHFSESYDEFRFLTMYPKLEYGLTNVHANPWFLLNGQRIDPALLQNCASVFFQDMRSLLSEMRLPSIPWEDVKTALMADEDVARGDYGASIIQLLKNDLKPLPVSPQSSESQLRSYMKDLEVKEFIADQERRKRERSTSAKMELSQRTMKPMYSMQSAKAGSKELVRLARESTKAINKHPFHASVGHPGVADMTPDQYREYKKKRLATKADQPSIRSGRLNRLRLNLGKALIRYRNALQAMLKTLEN